MPNHSMIVYTNACEARVLRSTIYDMYTGMRGCVCRVKSVAHPRNRASTTFSGTRSKEFVRACDRRPRWHHNLAPAVSHQGSFDSRLIRIGPQSRHRFWSSITSPILSKALVTRALLRRLHTQQGVRFSDEEIETLTHRIQVVWDR